MKFYSSIQKTDMKNLEHFCEKTKVTNYCRNITALIKDFWRYILIMSKLINIFNNNKNSGKWEGTIKLSFEMEESVYLLELLIKREEKIVVYDLNELNCIFEAKFKKAYTVAQYQAMSKVLMILDGISTSNIHLFSGCEYKNGKIGFEKGTYFKLCSCLIESKRTIREKGRTKEKQKTIPLYEKKLNVSKIESPAALPQLTVEQNKNNEVIKHKNNVSINPFTETKEIPSQVSKQTSDIGGISKEDFKRQIQAQKNK